MVLQSGKEKREELGEEVPSLMLSKGSACLQWSQMLPGIWVAAGTALERALEPKLGLRGTGTRHPSLWLWARGAALIPVFLPLSWELLQLLKAMMG